MEKGNIDNGQCDKTMPTTLREGVHMLRSRLSSVHLETLAEDSDTRLSIRFTGDETNLSERKLLVENLVRYLPSALSIIGVKNRQEQLDKNSG